MNNGFDHIVQVVSVVVFLPQWCWSQFVKYTSVPSFQVSLYYGMHRFDTGLIRNLALIWLPDSRDYHLVIYKVHWYNLSMVVPIFTSFWIENSSQHSGWQRKLLALISLFTFVFVFIPQDPHVSTQGIASFINCRSCRADFGLGQI